MRLRLLGFGTQSNRLLQQLDLKHGTVCKGIKNLVSKKSLGLSWCSRQTNLQKNDLSQNTESLFRDAPQRTRPNLHRTERFDSSLHRKWWYRRLSMRPPLRLCPLRLCLRRPCFAHHCHRRINHHRRHRQAHTGECTKSSGARRRRCSICRVRRRSARWRPVVGG